MDEEHNHPVAIEDGLTDQQRRGAELAAAGWAGVDIASELNVRPETVSRWRKLPAWQAAHEAVVAEVRGELEGALTELAGAALGELEQLLTYRHDPGIRLRAATALLQMAGVGRAQRGTSRGGRFGAGAAAGGD
ncbi:hypothetical protein [uncultured Thiohalocapsa sp.]|uniref:hypothetical protein n=1 Tax=uncultured Thiohalocapsa sp. TaxID=768990 RepID=UPI0025EBC9C2|nr:hypothetical protein [uncultured Thiohalocapsa sp.]